MDDRAWKGTGPRTCRRETAPSGDQRETLRRCQRARAARTTPPRPTTHDSNPIDLAPDQSEEPRDESRAPRAYLFNRFLGRQQDGAAVTEQALVHGDARGGAFDLMTRRLAAQLPRHFAH